MRTPSTTDAYFVLCDEHIEPPQAESLASPFPFPQLIEDMQRAVTEQLDKATRCSFSWTCKAYLKRFGDKDFDCFAFADKCAELGYRALLHYSVEQGGPFDLKTSNFAAFYGRLDILQMFAKRTFKDGWKIFPKLIPDSVSEWARIAACAGQHQVLEWLKVNQWQHVTVMVAVAEAAAKHDDLDTALNLYERAKALPDSFTTSQFSRRLLEAVGMGGGLKTVQKILQLLGAESERNWHDLLKYIDANRNRVSIISWLFEQFPAIVNRAVLERLVRIGVVLGDVKLLELAEMHGAIITIDSFRGGNLAPFPHVNALKFMHQKFNLPAAPFELGVGLPISHSEEDVQWMEEHGYKFDFSPTSLAAIKAEHLASAPWIFKRVGPTAHVFRNMTLFCNVALLDLLWEVKANDVSPDSYTMERLLSCDFNKRFRLKPMLDTIHWLQSKGYTFGSKTESCDQFVAQLLEKKRGLFRAYWDEINALHMPLAAATSQRVARFIAISHKAKPVT